mgnify:CR=1 FL=1
MRAAVFALIMSIMFSAPVFGYDRSNHPKPVPNGSFYEQGRIQVHQGKWERAVLLFQKAVSKNAKNYKAYTLLGYSFRHSGRLIEAIEAYNRAVEISPGYAELREYRGKALVLAGRSKAAMRDYAALVRMGSPLAEDLKIVIDKGI